ncbi:MAG: hypothetical protein RL653_3369 [Pseudomonadota bacterium]|jgi:hypothetical protein
MPVNDINALKSRFNSALRNGVTTREVESLIKLVKDGGGVTNSERRQLRELFIANGDKFEARAKERMNKFISEEMTALLIDDAVVGGGTAGTGGTRRDLADPAVMKDDTNLKYEWVNGQLFVGGVSKDDVVQGMIGNCYLVAAFSSVAAQSPKAIQDAIKDNGDGTYTVRFFQTSYGSSSATPVNITVDGQLPTRWGGLNYGKGKDRSELWVPLLEKAYAQWKGGFENIGHGGAAGEVMAALTGRRASYTWLSTSSNEQSIFNQVKSSLAAGRSVAAGTHGEESKPMYTGTGMYANHAYSITGTSEENGVRYVHLRNPWGEVEPSGNGPDDGNFRIPVKDFLKFYSGLYIS